MSSKISQQSYNKKIQTLLIVFGILITILFVVQWFCLNSSISKIQDINQQEAKSLKSIKTNLLDVSKLKEENGVIKLQKSDINTINDNLNKLAEEIFNERNKAETIIDKDIDRLNLYMALGIGFIAILGIFVPLLINYLSYDELKENQNRLNNSYQDLLVKTEDLPDSKDLSKVVEDSKILLAKSEEIEKLREATEIITPKISTIGLQIAINRLFTVNAIALRNYSKGDSSLYTDLFKGIVTEMNKCKDDELHTIENHTSLRQTIKDFSIMLNDEKYRFSSIFNSKGIDNKLTELSQCLENLSNSKSINEKEYYSNCEEILKKIITTLENKNDSL